MTYLIAAIMVLLVIIAVLLAVRLYQAHRHHEEMYRAFLDLAEMIGEGMEE